MMEVDGRTRTCRLVLGKKVRKVKMGNGTKPMLLLCL